MSLDFSPAPKSAPRSRQVVAHGRTEASLVLRNGEQALLALVIPIGILVAGRWFADALGQPFSVTAPSVLALATWSTCFTSLAIATGFERRYNVLERLAATPLGKPGILLGKAVGFGIINTVQLGVLAAVALAFGWRPGFDAGHLAVAVVSLLLAMGAFAGFALALAGSARPEITLAIANMVYLVGMFTGILVPLARYPEWAQPIIQALPTGALGEALRSGTAVSMPLLLVACAIGLALARRVFRWTS